MFALAYVFRNLCFCSLPLRLILFYGDVYEDQTQIGTGSSTQALDLYNL